MDPLLVISPHPDDAVLSCGQLMAGREDCLVVTVFAGLPARPRMLTTYDRDCGFRSAAEALTERGAEDIAALSLLGARSWHLTHPDHQYREVEGTGADPVVIAADLLGIVDADPLISVVFGPLGLAHPDHLATAEALRLLLRARPDLEGWVYEDMPARVLWPEQVPARLDWWRDAGYDPILDFAGTGPLDAKEAAVGCYRSQLGSLRTVCGGNLYPVLVPERHYRLWRQA